MHTRNEDDGVIYIGALLFGLIVNVFNGFAELSIAISRLPVFYKHRDLLFYPAWVFTLPNFLLRIPMSILETIVWTAMTYYTIGYAPEASSVFAEDRWYWIGAVALLGFSILFNLLFTFFLMCLNRKLSTNLSVCFADDADFLPVPLGSARLYFDAQLLGNRKLLYLKKKKQQEWKKTETKQEREMLKLRMSSSGTNGLSRDASIDTAAAGVAPKRGMVLPFTPLTMSFDEVNYYVDMPPVSSLTHCR
ncbi:hypothetical protein GW17_00048230 [Ensete ventricosum]|nr:hypothetical protein GW17_00048230 [Ensete ventricosum]